MDAKKGDVGMMDVRACGTDFDGGGREGDLAPRFFCRCALRSAASLLWYRRTVRWTITKACVRGSRRVGRSRGEGSVEGVRVKLLVQGVRMLPLTWQSFSRSSSASWLLTRSKTKSWG